MEVTKIPKKRVTVIDPKRSVIVDKAKYNQLRVAAYCRVSTDSEEQLTSYNTQMKVYTEMISAKKEWTFAGMYADATCIIGTNQSPSERAAICPYFSYFQSIWRRHTR